MKLTEKTILQTCVEYIIGSPNFKTIDFPKGKTYHLIFDKKAWSIRELKDKLNEIPDDAKLASMDYIDDCSTLRFTFFLLEK